MNPCPAQENMKHCHHGSTRQGAASNKLHSMSYGAHTMVRRSFLWNGDISEHDGGRSLTHMYSPCTARHVDATPGLWHVCLRPHCDSKQTQSNEIHCREPVSSKLGARWRGRDSHTVMFPVSQQVTFHPSRRWGFLLLLRNKTKYSCLCMLMNVTGMPGLILVAFFINVKNFAEHPSENVIFCNANTKDMGK